MTNKTREVTFSPEALQAVIAQAVALALAGKKAASKATADNGLNAKSERSIQNEIAAVKAFKKAGFGAVKPKEDVKTYRRWMADGFRVIEGTKGIKVKGFILFHKTQVRELTLEEKTAMQKQSDDAIARHEAEQQEQKSNVVELQ